MNSLPAVDVLDNLEGDNVIEGLRLKTESGPVCDITHDVTGRLCVDANVMASTRSQNFTNPATPCPDF